MIEIVRRTQRNIKRWRSGEMRLRWTAAGMLEAEKQFRRIRGHRELPLLLAALHAKSPPPTTPTPSAPSDTLILGPPLKFHSNWDILEPSAGLETGRPLPYHGKGVGR
jgi:hypothetical protein